MKGVALGTSGTHIHSTSIASIFLFITSSLVFDIISSLAAFTIVLATSSCVPNTKKESVPKDKGYRYPMIKGLSSIPSSKKRGGRKTRRKHRKTKKNNRLSRRKR